MSVASPPTVAGPAADSPGGGDATAALDTGSAAPGSAGRKSRLGLALAGVAAAIVVAGGVVLATAGSDDGDASAPASDSTPAEEADDAGSAADASDRDSEAPSDSETDAGAAPTDESDRADAPVDAAGAADAPVVAAEEFFDAVATGDCEGMVSRMTPASFGPDGQSAEEAIAECESDPAGTTAASLGRWGNVRLVSMDGDEATIAVTLRVGAQEHDRELPMVLDDGEWKMDLDVTASPSL